jgi:hypothetical protein
MASIVYNSFKGRIFGDDSIVSSAINLKTDTIKIALLTSSYTPDADHDYFSDVSAYEVAASGSYSAGGATLTKTLSTDDTDDEGVFDANDVSFTSASIAARYAVVYKDTGNAATSPLICLIDFGSTYTSTAGTFSLPFNAEGILNLN